jgi:hypothetical protein
MVQVVLEWIICLPQAPPAHAQPEQPIDGGALVRPAIQNRDDAAKTDRPLRYLLRKTDDRRDTIQDIIETGQGDVARLIAINNQPLTAEANQAEPDRLNTLANHEVRR